MMKGEGITAYDAAYVALAQRLSLPLVTGGRDPQAAELWSLIQEDTR